MMDIFLNVIMLLLIGVVAYVLLIKLISHESAKKRARLSRVLNRDNPETMSIKSKFPFFNYFVPTFVMDKAKSYHSEYTKRMYVTYFLTGTLIGVVMFIVYFQALLPLLPFSLLGGVLATVIKLQAIKREYVQKIDFQLKTYTSTLTTAYGTFRTLKPALESILPSMDEPLKSDLEKAYQILSEGKSVSQAFYHLDLKYPYMAIRMFHEQLKVLEETGNKDTGALKKAAFKMGRKQIFKKKSDAQRRSLFKIWRAIAGMGFTVPFVFIVLSYEYYETIAQNLVTNVVLLGYTAFVLFIYRELAKRETFDPTDPNNSIV